MYDHFKAQMPSAVIRNPLFMVSGALLMFVSLFMLAGIFLFGLRADQGRVFICLFFGIPGLLGLILSILILSIKTEIYEEGFVDFPGDDNFFSKGSYIYADITAKAPVFARTLGGREYLHHYKLFLKDGKSVYISQWQMKPELLDRLRLNELPTVSAEQK